MLQGSFVAIVTPMHADGSLDIKALHQLIDFHVNEGTDGIVIVGTTGESPTVDYDEHLALIKTTVDYVDGRIKVIAGVVQFTEMWMEKNSPVLYQVLGIYLPLITTNCAVLGIPLLNVQQKHNFFESLVFGFGGALGFSLVLILFASMRERLEAADVPAVFQGAAIAMVTGGLMSLAFMGFAGLVR
jgi:Na+-translocating ferredoxin:NAD+ oxidoreductase RnfA subunit